jgi:hypothetical protein
MVVVVAVAEAEADRFGVVVAIVVGYCRGCCNVVEGMVAGIEAVLAALVVGKRVVVDSLVILGLYPRSTPQLPFFRDFWSYRRSKLMLRELWARR